MFKLVMVSMMLVMAGCSEAQSGCSKEEALKLIGAGFSKDEIVAMCGEPGAGASTARKASAVEGRLVDWNGEPVAGVKIVAKQAQPIKGYEQFEAVTGEDGKFRIEGLFPSSGYLIKPWSSKWRTDAAARIETAPRGETALLPADIVIERAFNDQGSLVTDLATGAARFSASDEGVITDAQTGLQWKVGPDEDTDYDAAEAWVASLGEGWRMPTRAELKSLYQEGVGERNMDPLFGTSGWWVWAEPRDSSSAWDFNFHGGDERWPNRNHSHGSRVFGVRSRPRR